MNTSVIIGTLGSLVAVFGFVWKIISSFLEKEQRYKNQVKKFKEDGRTYAPNWDIINSPYYVTIHGQNNINPDVAGIDVSNRYNLINAFLNEYLSKKTLEAGGPTRFFILAGSGQGKSLFVVKLLHSYLKKYKWRKSPYPIDLVYLGGTDCVKKIEEIENKSQTILILESFDENYNAVKNPTKFFMELDAATVSFKCVIITSRTQLFESIKDIPAQGTGIYNGVGRVHYKHIFLSPLTKEEIERYIRKKFERNVEDREKALNLAKRSDDLFSRPLLLSYIDSLLDKQEGKDRLSKSRIYEIITNDWIEHEIKIAAKGDKNKLIKFTQEIALAIYDNWTLNGEWILPNKKYKEFLQKFLEINDSSQEPYTYDSRSLITKDNDSNIKFTHKSILDYYIAQYSVDHPGKLLGWKDGKYVESLDDSVKDFIRDIISNQKRKDYTFISYGEMLKKIDEKLSKDDILGYYYLLLATLNNYEGKKWDFSQMFRNSFDGHIYSFKNNTTSFDGYKLAAKLFHTLNQLNHKNDYRGMLGGGATTAIKSDSPIKNQEVCLNGGITYVFGDSYCLESQRSITKYLKVGLAYSTIESVVSFLISQAYKGIKVAYIPIESTKETIILIIEDFIKLSKESEETGIMPDLVFELKITDEDIFIKYVLESSNNKYLNVEGLIDDLIVLKRNGRIEF